MSKLIFKGKVKEICGGKLGKLSQKTSTFKTGGSISTFSKSVCTLDTRNLSKVDDKRSISKREYNLSKLSNGTLSNRLNKVGKNKGINQFSYMKFNQDNLKALISMEFKDQYCTFFDNIIYTVGGVLTYAFKPEAPSSIDLGGLTGEVNNVDKSPVFKIARNSGFPDVKQVLNVEIFTFNPLKSLSPEDEMFRLMDNVDEAGELFTNDDLIEKAKLNFISKSNVEYALATAKSTIKLKIKNEVSSQSLEALTIEVKREFIDPNDYIFQLGLVIDRGSIHLAEDRALVDYSTLLFSNEDGEFRVTNVIAHYDASKVVRNGTLAPIALIYSNKDKNFIDYFVEEGRGLPFSLAHSTEYRVLDFAEGSGTDIVYSSYLISSETFNLLMATDKLDVSNLNLPASSPTLHRNVKLLSLDDMNFLLPSDL